MIWTSGCPKTTRELVDGLKQCRCGLESKSQPSLASKGFVKPNRKRQSGVIVKALSGEADTAGLDGEVSLSIVNCLPRTIEGTF